MKLSTWRSAAASAVLVLGLAACGDDTTTTTSDSGAPDSGSTGGAVTYADVQDVWDAKCAGSGGHTDGGTSGGLALDDGASHANLVGVASIGAAMDLVTAGSTEDSYLWHKLNGTQADVGGSGSDMPLGTSLTLAQLSTVETWILDGAAAD